MKLLFFVALLALATSAQSHSYGANEETVAKSMSKYVEMMYYGTSSNVTWQYGENAFTLQRPEGERRFYVYVPKVYTDAHPIGVHFSFHGLGDTCENYGRGVGFSDYAEKMTPSFLYVYPCGYSGLIGTAWHAGTCCEQSTDDVQFVRDMLSFLQSNFHVNTSQIWSSGFSNGAMFSERLACEAADVFSAVASVSGVVCIEPGNSAGLTSCDKAFKRPVNVLQIHGDADPVVPWTGDAILGFPTVPDDMSAWATRNKCGSPSNETLITTDFYQTLYSDCGSNVSMELVRHKGGAHQWPMVTGFETTDYIARFFARSAGYN